MTAPTILFLKALVSGYHRKDGTYVKPYTNKRTARAETPPGQLSLFTAPAGQARPKPPAAAPVQAPKQPAKPAYDDDDDDNFHDQFFVRQHPKNGWGAFRQHEDEKGPVEDWSGTWHATSREAVDEVRRWKDRILSGDDGAAADAKPEPRVLLTKPAS